MNDSAPHGGASFRAIGEDFQHLERQSRVITADVLDAWFDPAPQVLEKLREFLPFLARTSPPIHAEGLVEAIAAARGISPRALLTGSGSSSLLFTCLPRLIEPGQTILRLDPMYSEYDHLCRHIIGAQVVTCPLTDFRVDADAMLALVAEHRPHAVLLVNPNNPTGRLWPRADVIRFLDELPPETLVLIDETYIDYVPGAESLEALSTLRPKLFVLKSMSKVYALSGLRVGYLTGEPSAISGLARLMPPWPVSLMAQVAAVEALRQPAYYQQCWRETAELRRVQLDRLKVFTSHDTDVNWYLLEHDEAHRLASALEREDIVLREFDDTPSGFGHRFLRIAVKTEAENLRIANALLEAL
jgi:histidinol-phosphate/aromatic aminotransferase/cobyric acid decarboxylase-like protein